MEESRRRLNLMAEKANAEREAAEKKAVRLLKAHLDKEQLRCYVKYGHFYVTTAKNKYKITRGWSHNIQVIKDDKIIASLCAHPRMEVPKEDNMLAQKLWLEHDEDAFLKVANRSRLYN
jgi:hypothetical protein